jgi:hypothetical protein
VYVDRKGKLRRAYFLSENLKGRNHLEDLSVDGRVILK